MQPEIADRLRALGIDAVETKTHYLLTRGECLALVERATGGIGSTGLLTANGLAYLVWRDGAPVLAAKGVEAPATDEQAAAVRRFSDDVKSALG